MEAAFVRPSNNIVDSYLIFSQKQKKGESVEQFYSTLKELMEKCISKVYFNMDMGVLNQIKINSMTYLSINSVQNASIFRQPN